MNNDPANDWIVKLERRRDGKVYYYRYDGNLTARMNSSWRFDKNVATQLANAITSQHKDFKAKAMKFSSRKHRRKGNVDVRGS